MKILEKFDIEIAALNRRLEQVKALRENMALFSADLDDTPLAEKLSLIGTNGVDFDRPTREEIELALKTFSGGKWNKTLSGIEPPAISYESPHFFGQHIPLRLWAGQPPPSCHIEYEEVMVPARTERRAKLVCKEAEPTPEPAAVAPEVEPPTFAETPKFTGVV